MYSSTLPRLSFAPTHPCSLPLTFSSLVSTPHCNCICQSSHFLWSATTSLSLLLKRICCKTLLQNFVTCEDVFLPAVTTELDLFSPCDSVSSLQNVLLETPTVAQTTTEVVSVIYLPVNIIYHHHNSSPPQSSHRALQVSKDLRSK